MTGSDDGRNAAVRATNIINAAATQAQQNRPISQLGDDVATFGTACTLRDHEHGPTCGHVAIQHGDHVGYLHDGHLHCKVKTLLVQHVIESRDQTFGCQALPTHATHDHKHSATCGHERVPHDDHYDYLVGDELHHQHADHCDSHGIIRRRYGATQARGVSRNKKFNMRRKDIHKSTTDGDTPSPTCGKPKNALTINTDEVTRVSGSSSGATIAPIVASAPWYHDSDTRSFVAMFFLTGSFFFVELIWGITGGSLALVADAMHMLSDAIALIVGFYALRVSRRGRSDTQTFGWTRMEVVAGLCNGMFLIGICFSICLESIQRFLEPPNDDLLANAGTILIVAIVGLGMNIIGLFLFGHGGHGHSHGGDGGHGHSHGSGASHDDHHDDHEDHHDEGHGHAHGSDHGHSHGSADHGHAHGSESKRSDDHGHSHGGSDHGHSHGGGSCGSGATTAASKSSSNLRYYHDGMHRELAGVDGAKKKRNGPRNMNMHGVLLHVLGDAFGSVAVIVSMCIIQYTNLPGRIYADPICSLVISFLILGSSVPLVRSCVAMLLQSVPAGIDLTAINGELLAVDGVVEVHELHVWQLNTDKVIASAHVLVEQGSDWMPISDQLKLIFHSHGVHNSTLQPEYVSRKQRRDLTRAARAALHAGLDTSSATGDTCHEPVCGTDCSSKMCCPPQVPSSTPLLISADDEEELVANQGSSNGAASTAAAHDDGLPDLVD